MFSFVWAITSSHAVYSIFLLNLWNSPYGRSVTQEALPVLLLLSPCWNCMICAIQLLLLLLLQQWNCTTCLIPVIRHDSRLPVSTASFWTDWVDVKIPSNLVALEHVQCGFICMLPDYMTFCVTRSGVKPPTLVTCTFYFSTWYLYS